MMTGLEKVRDQSMVLLSMAMLTSHRQPAWPRPPDTRALLDVWGKNRADNRPPSWHHQRLDMAV